MFVLGVQFFKKDCANSQLRFCNRTSLFLSLSLPHGPLGLSAVDRCAVLKR